MLKVEDLDDETVKWLECKIQGRLVRSTDCREDEYFGKREHERSAEEKKLKYIVIGGNYGGPLPAALWDYILFTSVHIIHSVLDLGQ